MVYKANYDCEPFNYDQRLFYRSVKRSLDMRLVRARCSKREMEVELSWILVVTLCVMPLALSQNCNGK